MEPLDQVDLNSSANAAGRVLGYEPRFERSFFARHGKRLAVVILILGLAIAAYFTWRPLTKHVLWLYWSHRCANFQMPANIELVVTDSRKRQLLANNPDYIPLMTGSPPTLIYSPRVWQELCKFDERCKWFGTDLAFRPTVPIAFLGTRTRPDGKNRLVIINGYPTTNAYNLLDSYRLMILPPPGIFEAMPKPINAFGGFAYSGRWEPAEIKAGVADPNDPTHITIDFVAGSAAMDEFPINGTIDAYLQNDDSLRLSLRSKISKYGYPQLGIKNLSGLQYQRMQNFKWH